MSTYLEEVAHLITYIYVLVTPMTTPFPGLTTKRKLPPAFKYL